MQTYTWRLVNMLQKENISVYHPSDPIEQSIQEAYHKYRLSQQEVLPY